MNPKNPKRKFNKDHFQKTCNVEIKNRFTILLKYFAGVNQMISQLRAFVLFKMVETSFLEKKRSFNLSYTMNLTKCEKVVLPHT